jgi:hypothetical protein
MKLKHIAGACAFFASLLLSVSIVGIPTRGIKSDGISPVKNQPVQQAETELQTRLRKFLEADRQTGYELSADLSHFRGVTNELAAEEWANAVLLKKMQRVDCVRLPDDFCLAWEQHFDAWEKKDDFLNEARLANKQWIDDDLRKDYSKLTVEINRTYYRMLEVAEKYGVYFTN